MLVYTISFEYCCDNAPNYLVTKFNTAHAKPNTKFCTQITIKKLLLHYLKIILNYFYVEKIPERTWVDLLYLRKCKVIRPSKFHTCHGIFSYSCRSVAMPARHLLMQMEFFQCLRPHKDSISKEINNNELSLHSMIKLSGWLCYTDADINQNALQAENVVAAFFYADSRR